MCEHCGNTQLSVYSPAGFIAPEPDPVPGWDEYFDSWAWDKSGTAICAGGRASCDEVDLRTTLPSVDNETHSLIGTLGWSVRYKSWAFDFSNYRFIAGGQSRCMDSP